MTQDNIKILADLSRIVERYGGDAVIRLANLIRDPQSAEEIATLLEYVAKNEVKNEAKASTRSKPRNSAGVGLRVISSLMETDPEKYSAVAELRDRLVSGQVLRSLNEIRNFAMQHGLSIGKATSRTAALSPLLRSISELEMPAIIALLESMPESNTGEGGLERWWELIVKPESPRITPK